MPDRPSAQSREPDRPELAEQDKPSRAPAARKPPLWRRILTPLALRVVGTVPADEAETVSKAISRVEQAAQAAQKASEKVQKALAAKPPLWRRILTPLALGIVGAVLLLLTFREYPRSPAPLENPGPAQLWITTAATVTSVFYSVDDPNGVGVTVYAKLPRRPRASASKALIEIAPRTAHNGPNAQGWTKTVRFSPDSVTPDGEAGFDASVTFSMTPDQGGIAYNGITASAAIPEVIISGSQAANPVRLDTAYYIPSGDSYDWSPSPPSLSLADQVWDTNLTSPDTAGQMMLGTNYAAESSDSNRTFIAGVLVALAGAAFLGAFQEALSRFAR
jgi:hypothetical protein